MNAHISDARFAALADPTRRTLLVLLANGEATVSDLAKPFSLTQPAISQHLKVLEDAGLVVSRQQGTARPRSLNKDGLRQVSAWFNALEQTMEKNYQRLEALLERTNPKQKVRK